MLNKKALAGSASTPTLNVADVFSADTYTGNGSTQTITNGIDLSGEGGLVWIKNRTGAFSNVLQDSQNGFSGGQSKVLFSNSTDALQTSTDDLSAFTSTGFTVGTSGGFTNRTNGSYNYVGWTFRKANKFFDVVTYTGTGSATTINHNLGSVPGMIWIKRTDTTANWAVYHRIQTDANYYTSLNLTNTESSDSTVFNGTAPTSTVFSVGTSSLTNASGGTYVAYIFAHETDAQGIIQCGGWTAGTGTTTITLGWQPQFLIMKEYANGSGSWVVFDSARGFSTSGNDKRLRANLTNAEDEVDWVDATSTGFNSFDNVWTANTRKVLYIAIKAE